MVALQGFVREGCCGDVVEEKERENVEEEESCEVKIELVREEVSEAMR